MYQAVAILNLPSTISLSCKDTLATCRILAAWLLLLEDTLQHSESDRIRLASIQCNNVMYHAMVILNLLDHLIIM